MARNGTLSARQEKALLALLTHPTVEQAAHAASVGLRTLWTWLKDPAFAEAYRAARREAVSRALARLQQGVSNAVSTLQAITADETAPTPARVSAAKIILELAVKSVELEDLEARLSTLERALQQQK
jgi:hypothetical protein